MEVCKRRRTKDYAHEEYSISRVTGKRQMKTMRYNFTLSRMAIILKRQTIASAGEYTENMEASCIVSWKNNPYYNEIK